MFISIKHIQVHIYIYKYSCPFLCFVTFIMFLYFLKTVQSFHIKIFTSVFGITLTITYSKNLFHSLTSPAGSCFGLFWGSFWHMFPCFLKTVQSFLTKVCTCFLYCSIGYCTKSFIFNSMSPSARAIMGYFLVYFWVLLSIS